MVRRRACFTNYLWSLARARLSIAVATALLVGGGLTALTKMDGWNIGQVFQADNVTRLAAVLGGKRDHSVPVTIIDIDEATFLAWGEPAAIPRDRLAGLLKLVRAGRPRAIVLDIDFSHDRTTEAAPIVGILQEGSAILDPPPLLLMRRLRRIPSQADASESVIDYPTVLDSSVAASPDAQWMTALFEAEDDWFYRRWRGFRAVCTDGRPKAYASVALGTTAIIRDPAQGLRVLESWLASAAKTACAHSGSPVIPTAATDPDWLKNAARDMTIPFAVGYTSDVARFGSTAIGNRQMPIFARLMADSLLQSGTPPDLTDRVAIIGASFDASNDFHRTPLGTMPGVYILANLVALGGGPLAESRWGGAKPFLIGAVLFALHVVTTLIFRQPFSFLVILFTTAILTVGAVLTGVAPYLVYEGALVGLTLIAIFVLLMPVLDELARSKAQDAGTHRIIRHILTERALRIVVSLRR